MDVNHLAECLEIQSSYTKSCVIKWSLHVSDNNDQAFSVFIRQYLPIRVINAVRHFIKTFECQRPKETVHKKIA